MTTFPKAPLKRFTDQVHGKDVPGPGTYETASSSSTARVTSFSKMDRTYASEETVFFTPEPSSAKTNGKSRAGFKMPALLGLKFSADKREKKVAHAKSTETVAVERNPEVLAQSGELREALAAAEANSERLADEKHSLTDALEGLKAENVDLVEELDLFKSAAHGFNEHIAELVAQNRALKEALATARASSNGNANEKHLLTDALEGLKTENVELLAQLDLLKSATHGLKEHIAELVAQNGDMKEALSAAQASSERCTGEKQSFFDDLERLKMENIDLLKEMDLLKSAVYDSKKYNTELLTQIAEPKEALAAAQASSNGNADEKHSLTDAVERLKMENIDLLKEMDLLKSSVYDSKKYNTELLTQIAELKEALAAAQASSNGNADEKHSLTDAVERLKMENIDLLKEMDLLKSSVLESKEYNTELLTQNGQLKETLAAAEANSEQLTDDKLSITDSLELLKTDNVELLKQMDLLKSAVYDWKQYSTELLTQNGELKETLAAAEANSEQLTDDKLSLTDSLERLNTENVDLLKQMDLLKSSVLESKEYNTELLTQNGQLKETLAAAEASSEQLTDDKLFLTDALERLKIENVDLLKEIVLLKSAVEESKELVSDGRSAETMKELENMKISLQDADYNMQAKASAVVSEINRIMFFCDGLEQLVGILKARKDLEVQRDQETKKENDLILQRDDEVKKEKDALIKVFIPLNDQSKGLTKEMEKLMGKLNKAEEEKRSVKAEHRRLQQESQQLNYQLKAAQESKSAVKAQEAKVLCDRQSAIESRSEIHAFLTNQKPAIERLVNMRKKGQSFHESIWMAAEKYGREIGHKNPSQSLRQSQNYAVENVKLKEENGCLKAANDQMKQQLKTLKR